MLCTTLLAASLLAGGACGGRHPHATGPIPTPTSAPDLPEAPLTAGASLETALAELYAAPVPAEVQPELFMQLRAELARQLAAAGKRPSSAPPQGEANCVSEIAVYGDTLQGFTLEWAYRNCGDYSQDGLVGIQDLTPIGLYFGRTQAAEDWDSAALADGDGNGEINIADITPIGQHFQAYCTGYKVFAAAAPDAAMVEVGEVALPGAAAGEPTRLSFSISGQPEPLYWVVPVDDTGALGFPSLPAAAPGPPAQVSLGAEVVDVTSSIGAAGGKLEGSSGSPVEQVSIEFPAGALPGTTEVTLGYNTGSVIPADGRFVGPIITLSADAVTEFSEPVLITIPYTPDDGYLPLLYDVGADGRLAALQLYEMDDSSGRATFLSFHASDKAEIDARTAFASFEAIGTYSCNFRVRRDNFQIRNRGSNYAPDGECFGMSAWALWYFRYYAATAGPFYPRYMEPLDGVTGQDLIATRAQISIHRQLKSHYAEQSRERTLMYSDFDNFCLLRGALLETKLPVLACAGSPGLRESHSALFLGFTTAVFNTALEPGAGQLERYVSCSFADPNVPRHALQSRFLLPEGAASPQELRYGGYTASSSIYFETTGTPFKDVVLEGDGSLYLSEPYSNILADADAGFHSSRNATINVSSHAAGGSVSSPQITLAGTVESGEILVALLGVMVNDAQLFTCSVAESGEFSLPLTLFWGANALKFQTAGYEAFNNLVEVQNNLVNGFTLTGDFPAAMINLTSHTPGAKETHRLATLAGQITGPQEIARIEVKANELPAGEALVQPGGSFSLGVRLEPEENQLAFRTLIPDGEGGLVPYPNNLESGGFTLTGDFEYAVAMITTAWEPADTLGGVVIWNKDGLFQCSGASAGCGGRFESSWDSCVELFYFVEADAEILYDSPYLVRPCFIHDSRLPEDQDEPLRYTIELLLYEGLPFERREYYTGSIAHGGIIIGWEGPDDIYGEGWGTPFTFLFSQIVI